MQKESKKTLRLYWSHAKKYRWLLVGMLLFMLITTALDLGVPYLYKLLFDAFTSELPRGEALSMLINILWMIAGFGLLHWIFQRGVHFFTGYFEVNVMKDLYDSCFEYLHKHSHRFFTDNFAGSLVKKVGRFVRSFEVLVDRLYFDLVPLFLKIFFIFIILVWVHPLIGAVLLSWSIIFMISTLWFTRFKWKYDIERAEMDTKITGLLADTITNNPNLKFFANLSFEIRKFSQLGQKWAKKTVFEWNISQIADGFQGLMMIALEFLVLYLAIKSWAQGTFTLGDIIWVETYVMELLRNIWRFGRNVRDVYRSLADAEEMTQVISLPHEVKDLKNAMPIHITGAKIEFENVSFSYTSEDTEVVRGLSFKIKSGEKVALVGPSGGGKTTLTKLILRLFDIQKGHILVDGQDIKKVTQDSLRSQISFVPQDPILFHRTIMENIRYGRLNARDEEVMVAAKLANCHEFISTLPKKYQTYVGERGVKLSGGERQRVAIARAVLANTQLLILDEATSSLDSVSESLIQEALTHLMKNKTTLVIAHRLSTITKMDRILVLQGGKIIEDGVHSDLIHHESGLYRKLWDLQVGGYID